MKQVENNNSNYIEEKLGISLPAEYKELFDNFPIKEHIGETDSTFIHNAMAIVKHTIEYRNGYANCVPEWPKHLLYLGDNGAACPYALDTTNKMVYHFDHGNPNAKHLSEDLYFNDWIPVQLELIEEFKDQYDKVEPGIKEFLLGSSLIIGVIILVVIITLTIKAISIWGF